MKGHSKGLEWYTLFAFQVTGACRHHDSCENSLSKYLILTVVLPSARQKFQVSEHHQMDCQCWYTPTIHKKVKFNNTD